MTGPINRLNDYVFKRIFGVEENKDILIDFLNSIILTDVSGPLVDLSLSDREIDPEFLGDKASRLDILATAQNGTRINIEVQIVNLGGPERRTLFYWSRLYGGQLVSGVEYRILLPVITINVINFEFLPGADRFHQTFLLTEMETHEHLTRDCEIHFIEIPKFKRLSRFPKTKLEKWLTYLGNVQGKEMERIAMKEAAIKKALTVAEIFAKSDQERRLYELREKGLHDLASIRGLGREEGFKEGREEGREKGREEGLTEGCRSVAKRLLAMGLPDDQIAQATGLSMDEIRSLKVSRVSEPSRDFEAKALPRKSSKPRRNPKMRSGS